MHEYLQVLPPWLTYKLNANLHSNVIYKQLVPVAKANIINTTSCMQISKQNRKKKYMVSKYNSSLRFHHCHRRRHPPPLLRARNLDRVCHHRVVHHRCRHHQAGRPGRAAYVFASFWDFRSSY